MDQHNWTDNQISLTFQSDAKPDSEHVHSSDNASFSPERLSLARRRRGLTKTDLSTEVGLEVRTISGYEAGEYIPSHDALESLSRALRFPKGFFFGDPLQEPRPDTASFRAQSKMSASQRDMALGQGAIALALAEWLDKHFELPSPAIPSSGRGQTPEAAAEALRQEWGLGNASIRNMVHLLESKGVRIFSLSLKAKEVDAFSLWQGGTPYIFLNTQKSAEHSRFDAAHELGHLALHKHAAPQGRQSEKEADAFASAFLMPRASVLANVPKLATVEQLIKLKKNWAVSAAALAYRYHSLKVITDWHYRSLFVQLSKRGFTKNEPHPAPHESSQLLAKVFTSLRQEGITRHRVASELNITTRELDDLLLGLTFGTFVGGGAGDEKPKTTPNLKRVK
jgi:Zn-dependent peptidase ImmA (M78 family)/transcriptional regulator with XRE-family HTH domain